MHLTGTANFKAQFVIVIELLQELDLIKDVSLSVAGTVRKKPNVTCILEQMISHRK